MATINFDKINSTALAVLPALAKRWLPEGRLIGRNWVAKNPRSATRPRSEIKIDLASGRWDDFDIGEHGHGAIRLAAYLFELSQDEAVQGLESMLGIG